MLSGHQTDIGERVLCCDGGVARAVAIRQVFHQSRGRKVAQANSYNQAQQPHSRALTSVGDYRHDEDRH